MRTTLLITTAVAALLLTAGAAPAQTLKNIAPQLAPAAQRSAPAEKIAPPMHAGERKAPETTGQGAQALSPGHGGNADVKGTVGAGGRADDDSKAKANVRAGTDVKAQQESGQSTSDRASSSSNQTAPDDKSGASLSACEAANAGKDCEQNLKSTTGSNPDSK